MFEALDKALRSDINPLEAYHSVHIVCDENGIGVTNTGFLIHHFISYFLKHKFKVCLVTLSQSLRHYAVIQQKLGNNLTAAITSNQAAVVDCLQLTRENHSNTESRSNNSLPQHKSFLSDPLTAVEEEIEKALSKVHEQKTPVLLILDDLDIFVDIGVSPAAILLWLCRLQNQPIARFTTLLTSCCQRDPITSSADLRSLNAYLIHRSDVTLHLNELSTGLSKDLHGQLTVRTTKYDAPSRPSIEKYHYKCTDRDVKLFAPGSSPAVL